LLSHLRASGACSLGPPALYVEVNENLSPYQLGNVHRHTVEIEQELSRWGVPNPSLIFSPHLVPLSQGMLATIYVPWPEDLSLTEISASYQEDYSAEPFIQVLASGSTATVGHTRGTNRCALSLHPVRQRNTMIVVSSLDNLIKGAAGQAVQNFNRVFGFPETAGLL
jgi:N-acetyl-gamma-glutamyl-phosphate reductase